LIIRPWFVSLATAALVLIAVGTWRAMSPPAPVVVQARVTPWGWQRPGVIAGDVNRQAYLNRLADAAEEWFAKRPATASALADRLTELRRGCTTLILADHPPLTPADRQWLVQKCRGWATVIDGHLAALEAGKPTDQVETDADATVRKLSHALREKAKEA
jgi:hypothetical protein